MPRPVLAPTFTAHHFHTPCFVTAGEHPIGLLYSGKYPVQRSEACEGFGVGEKREGVTWQSHGLGPGRRWGRLHCFSKPCDNQWLRFAQLRCVAHNRPRASRAQRPSTLQLTCPTFVPPSPLPSPAHPTQADMHMKAGRVGGAFCHSVGEYAVLLLQKRQRPHRTATLGACTLLCCPYLLVSACTVVKHAF